MGYNPFIVVICSTKKKRALFYMKTGTVFILFILIAGLVCPAKMIILKTGNTSYLMTLNVCDVNGSVLSDDSPTPAVAVSTSYSLVPFCRDLTYEDQREFYQFLSITKLIKPPAV